MSEYPESWRRPDPNAEPTTLQEELKTPVEEGEEYKARTARRDLKGEAAEADVIDQASVVWQGDDEQERELG